MGKHEGKWRTYGDRDYDCGDYAAREGRQRFAEEKQIVEDEGQGQAGPGSEQRYPRDISPVSAADFGFVVCHDDISCWACQPYPIPIPLRFPARIAFESSTLAISTAHGLACGIGQAI